MLIIGVLVGVFLGLVLAAVAWASGRRPYLRVDINQHLEIHSTTSIVHSYVDPHPVISESPRQAIGGRLLARAVLPGSKPRQIAALPARKEIGR